MTESFNVAFWLAALGGGLFLTTYLLKRLFGESGGSVAKDFETHVDRARRLEADIKKLKEESTRDTANFEAALKKHRAKYGTGKRPDADPR